MAEPCARVSLSFQHSDFKCKWNLKGWLSIHHSLNRLLLALTHEPAWSRCAGAGHISLCRQMGSTVELAVFATSLVQRHRVHREAFICTDLCLMNDVRNAISPSFRSKIHCLEYRAVHACVNLNGVWTASKHLKCPVFIYINRSRLKWHFSLGPASENSQMYE